MTNVNVFDQMLLIPNGNRQMRISEQRQKPYTARCSTCSHWDRVSNSAVDTKGHLPIGRDGLFILAYGRCTLDGNIQPDGHRCPEWRLRRTVI